MDNENVSRISVKIEVSNEDYDGGPSADLNLVRNVFEKALDQIGFTYEDVTQKFFTLRFDETHSGLAGTVTAAQKRES